MNIQDKLICPKCSTRNLRKAHGRNPIAEFFCDYDHEYFTTWELVNIWNYDAGDFVNKKGNSLLPRKFDTTSDVECKHIITVGFPLFIPQIFQYGKQCVGCLKIFIDSEDTPPEVEPSERIDTLDMFEGEPIWSSEKERDEAYAMVHRMFLDIPEYKDYQDLKNTQECALDRGIQ